MGTVFLDRQHSGKPGKALDRGAWGDLDHDGAVDFGEQEASLTAQYLLHAEFRLGELGHSVLPLSDGTYTARHARVGEYCHVLEGPWAYVAAHLNSGGGNDGLVFHDARSDQGRALAAAVAGALKVACPELDQCKPVGARESDWTRRALSTIAGIYPTRAVGICYEPAFLDSLDHVALLGPDGLRRMGYALAEGIDQWAKS